MKTLILGLGNTILSDDAVGIIVAKQIYDKVKSEGIFYCESSYSGWRLLDLFRSYDRVIIIDVIQTDNGQVGKCYKVEPHKNLSVNLQSSHGLGLFESIELAKQNGWSIPDDISVYAIGVKNPYEFGVKILPEVARKIPEIVEKIIQQEFEVMGKFVDGEINLL